MAKTGLARPARPGHRHAAAPRATEQRRDLGQLAVAADQRRRGDRQPHRAQAAHGRELVESQLVEPHTRSRSLSRCSPRSRTTTSGTSSWVAPDRSTWPPFAAAAMRAARCTSNPTYHAVAERPPRRCGSRSGPGARTRPAHAGHSPRPRRHRPRTRTPRRTSRPRSRSPCRRAHEDLAHPTAMLAQQPPVLLRPQALQMRGRTLDVREEERHGPGRRLRHVATIANECHRRNEQPHWSAPSRARSVAVDLDARLYARVTDNATPGAPTKPRRVRGSVAHSAIPARLRADRPPTKATERRSRRCCTRQRVRFVCVECRHRRPAPARPRR